MAGNAGYSTDSGGTSQNTIKSVEHNAKQKLKKVKTPFLDEARESQGCSEASGPAAGDGSQDRKLQKGSLQWTQLLS